ncbi:Two pore domain potassium channel domain protein [Kalmanozyma brasiliensis GHG001]|uniref:Potassium channel domain-containing protein n=1 Tax=Kalmanozyma brasiliensis (strain GHG001) TaxID=1365824 RepID=V5GFN1_KALBG|nr:Two pore domain potassium channel domain protein [Kalmanozyma brasiliensis GHG001]EST04837.1 Two pore domain potassium channel domain protein [Kalmanozyma brasiliensis GHG001]
MSNTDIATAADRATASEGPAMLPSAASLQPTHITSHLPPIKSLQVSHDANRERGRSPFRRRKPPSAPDESHHPPTYTSSGLPHSNTLQTFLSVNDAPPFSSSLTTRHDDHNSQGESKLGHAWRVRKTPIFSGLLAPFSIVLEVPGLTSKWYAKIDSNGIVERFIDNPPILTVGLAISLSAAVVGNAAIVMRFLEILRPRQSIALAITGFVLHDLINVVALATFGGIYGPKKDGLSLSAAYWMVCASTITSTLVTISLVADFVRTRDFRHAGSGLTQLQKGLVLAGMGLLLYLSLGSLIFVYVIQIDFITALYFSTATILTVGFGDVVPPSPGGKVLVILYAPTGIVLVALVVSSARNTMLETFQAALMARSKERRRRIADRKAAHQEMKRQDRALRKIMPRTFTFGPTTVHTTTGQKGEDEGNDFAQALARMEAQVAGGAGKGTDSSADTSAASSSSNAAVIEKDTEPGPATAGDPALQREISLLQQHLLTAKRRTEEDFRHFEEHARREAISSARMKLALAASVTIAFWLLGAIAFTYAERWSYGGALWFCFIAMITIGYGDYHPATQLGRAIFVIWGLMGVAVLTILLAVVQDAFGSVFHRVLTKSTSRLFTRAEARARKRRLRSRKRKEEEQRRSEDEEEDLEATATADLGKKAKATRARRRSRPRQLQRKSEGDLAQHSLPNDIAEAATAARKSMEACIEGAARSGSPEAMHESALPRIDEPSSMDDLSHPHLLLPPHAAARMEDALVSTPQKLALAALQTFQHSVQVLHLHETSISQAMADIPALRHYYNSRQPPSSTSATSERLDPETALQNLHAAIRKTANPEHDKVAKLVVANLEFEHQLRTLLEGFQGLKDRVEGFKQVQLQRSRTLSLSSEPQRQAQESSE